MQETYTTGQSIKVRRIKKYIAEEGITQELVKNLFNYDPDTGIFIRKVFVNSRARAGDAVGSKSSNGYLHVVIGRKIINLHRLAFLYMEGYFPENFVDHINRDRTDNRWCNLREVSISCNMRNSSVINPLTGVRGVRKVIRSCFLKRTSRKYGDQLYYFTVSIRLNGKQASIGTFKDMDEAVCHRFAAEQCASWNQCDENSSAYLYLREQGIVK